MSGPRKGPSRRLLSDASRMRLIKFVRNHEGLYNPNHQDYYNKPITDSLWNQIGGEVGISGTRARMQWKNLRDVYRVQKKKVTQGKQRGGKWLFWDLMTFMEPYMTHRGNHNTVWEFDRLQAAKSEMSQQLELAEGSSSPQEVIAGWTVKMDLDAENTNGGDNNNELTQDSREGDFANEELNDELNSTISSDTNTLKTLSSVPMPKRRWMTDVEMCQIMPQPNPTGITDIEPIVEAIKEIGSGLNRSLQDLQDEEAAYGAYIAAKMRSIPQQDRQRIKLQIEQLFTDIHYSAE